MSPKTPFRNIAINQLFAYKTDILFKMQDFALNDLQGLRRHKTPFNELIKCKILVFKMVQETGVQSQVEYYQRLKKWYLISTC